MFKEGKPRCPIEGPQVWDVGICKRATTAQCHNEGVAKDADQGHKFTWRHHTDDILMTTSLDWFKGKFTGKPHI